MSNDGPFGANNVRYRDLAELLAEQIRRGDHQPQQRLPSLRQFALSHGVSMTTAQNCYRWLEAEGWISAVPKSGYYVQGRIAKAPQPTEARFTSQITQPTRTAVELPGVALGPLGISHLSPQLLPSTALQRAMKRALQRMGEKLHRYPDRQGEPQLQAALHAHFQRYQLAMPADQWVITHGCLDAVRAAIESCTQPGDAIAINSPCFNGLLNLLAGLNRRVVEIPATAEGIDLNQLERHLARKEVQAGLFSTSHMNPQGKNLSTEQKQRLAQLAGYYQTPVIEDDVFLELSFNKVPPLPAKYWDTQGYILWCGSISKSLSASMRLGWCVPGRFLTQLQQRQASTHYGVSPLNQLALADLINSGEYHRHLQALRPRLAALVQAYRRTLIGELPQAAISNPDGGTVLWLQQKGLDANAVAAKLHQQGIDIRAGNDFTTRALYGDCLRINAGYPLTANGLKTLAAQQLATLVATVNTESAQPHIHSGNGQ